MSRSLTNYLSAANQTANNDFCVSSFNVQKPRIAIKVKSLQLEKMPYGFDFHNFERHKFIHNQNNNNSNQIYIFF